MRRLNLKLFLYCFGGLALFVGALFVVHELQAGSISSALLYQAEQAEKEGRLKQATRYLSRYLDFVPDDVEVRARLGKALADPRMNINNRARERARFVLEQVLARNPERHDVRCCLAKLLLDAGFVDLAEEHLNALKKAQPNDGQVAGLLGQWQELKGEATDALQQLRVGVKNGAASVDSYVRLMNLLRRMDRGQRGPNFKEAEEHLAAALAKGPEHVGVLLAAADLAIDRDDPAKAQGHLERALKLHPGEARVYLAQARLALHRNKRDEAIAALRHGGQTVPEKERYELTWALANLLIDAGKLDEARTVTAKIREDAPTTGAGDYLEARGMMQEGRWFEAARTLERVRAALKGATDLAVQVDLMLGLCYEQLDEPMQQLAACFRAAKADPLSAQARRGIAAAQWALGQADQAIDQCRALVKLNEDLKAPTGRAELARMLLLRTLQMEKKDWRPVEDELNAAEKEQPDSPEITLLRAEMLAARKKLDDAVAVVMLGLRAQPRRVEYWTALASLAERKGEPDKAGALLDEARKQAGDSVELRLARARLLASKPPAETRSGLRKLEENVTAFSAGQRETLWNGLAEAQLRADSPDDAARLWGELANQPGHTRDLRLRLLLFDVAMQRKDDAGMQRLLEEIRTIEGGEAALTLFGQASRKLYLARRGDRANLSEARALLDRVVTIRPAWPAVLLAKAELEQMEGNVEQAIANYRRAVEAGVRTPRVIRQLVELLSSRQRYDEAEAELRKLQLKAPLSPELQRMHEALRGREGGLPATTPVAKAGAMSESKDYRDQLWAGQVLFANNRASPEAEKALRRAVELADSVPETWVALVKYLSATGQAALAEAEVEKARAKLTGPEAPLALAQCYEAAAKPEKVRAQLRAALEARPQDVQVRRAVVGFTLRSGSAREAEPHLRAVLDRKVNAGDADVAWARRALALTLASAADHKRYPEALKLVGFGVDAKGEPADDGPAPNGGWSGEDQVVRARVLATQQRHAFRIRAIALLEDVYKREALAPDDQLLLAQLYQGMGDEDRWWPKARDLMQALVGTHPGNAMYLSLFAQGLMQHGDYVEAERVVTGLEKLEKTRQRSLGVAELKAQVLAKRGKSTQALALLKAYAEAPGARPDRILLYAGLQARLGHLKEALDVCEQARKTCPPEVVGGASVSVLRDACPPAGKPVAAWQAQAARVEGWLREASAKAPDSAGLQLELADLLDLLGRAAEAEKLYRAVLTRDPAHHVALNNLSWLLAQRKDTAAEAVALVGKAMETHGQRAELLDTRAVAYLSLGETEKALADLQQAVADAPTAAKYFHLTRAHHMARNPRAARAALARATAAGLTAERLHPAERETYRRLLAELEQ